MNSLRPNTTFNADLSNNFHRPLAPAKSRYLAFFLVILFFRSRIKELALRQVARRRQILPVVIVNVFAVLAIVSSGQEAGSVVIRHYNLRWRLGKADQVDLLVDVLVLERVSVVAKVLLILAHICVADDWL